MAVDTISKALYARLTGYAGLSSLVGTRVFPGAIPQDTIKPACYYDIDSDMRLSTDDGDGTYRIAEVTVTAVADSYANAELVTKQVEAALARWTQTTPLQVIESLVSNEGIMPVEETEEWIGVTEASIQYFTP